MRLLRLALKVARRTPAATEGGHTEMELMYLDKQIRVRLRDQRKHITHKCCYRLRESRNLTGTRLCITCRADALGHILVVA